MNHRLLTIKIALLTLLLAASSCSQSAASGAVTDTCVAPNFHRVWVMQEGSEGEWLCIGPLRSGGVRDAFQLEEQLGINETVQGEDAAMQKPE